jgi:acyl carrier protein
MRGETNISAKERVVGIVAELLHRRSVSHQVATDDDLQNIGLTSLDMVNLMLSVEAEFDVRIPDNEMILRNFRSVSAIDLLVTTLLRQK